MGKYDNSILDEPNNGYKAFIIFANELAEANRLKRIELKRIFGMNDNQNLTKDLFEDQA